MKILKIQPGPKIGEVLNILLGEILDKPDDNKKTYLKKRVSQIGKLSDKEIVALAKKAKAKRDEIITKKDQMTKKKYWVS